MKSFNVSVGYLVAARRFEVLAIHSKSPGRRERLAATCVCPRETLVCSSQRHGLEIMASAWQVLESDEIVVRTDFNSEASEALLEAADFRAASEPVDVSIVSLETLQIRNVTSSELFYVRLRPRGAFDVSRSFCAYFDPKTESWSREGVRIATAAELEMQGVEGLWCASTHLTIFAVFWDFLLDCTNVNVLSEKHLKEVLEPHWWFRPPSLLLWLLVTQLLLLICAGFHVDHVAQSSGLWRDEYFLTQVAPVSRRCCRRRQEAKQEQSEEIPHKPSTVSLRDMVPVIDQKQVRDLKKSLLTLVKPTWQSKMQDESICRNTLRCLAMKHKVHVRTLGVHIWGMNGWVQGSLAVEKSAKLKSLVMELEEDLPKAFLFMHSSRLGRVWRTFAAAHPAYQLFFCDLNLTAAKRGKIFMDCVLGSLAFVALFFSVDGSAVAARSPSDCPVRPGSILYYTLVALLSVLLNFIPRSLMYMLAWRDFAREEGSHRRQLLKRRYWDLGFWLMSVTMSCLHLLMITGLVANLREADEWKWLVSFSVVVLRKLLLVPLLACFLSSITSEITLVAQPELVRRPARKFGLELPHEEVLELEKSIWSKKVEELAMRGITISQLLDFYIDLQHPMPQFDPEISTTHDVVRQAIIPASLKFKPCGTAKLLVQSDCLHFESLHCSVHSKSGIAKPWKGGGFMENWEQLFILHDISEEDIHFTLKEETAVVPVSFGRPFSFQVLLLGESELGISIDFATEDHLEGSGQAKMDDEPLIGYSYATAVNCGQKVMAQKMVTHNWGNKFAHLLGAIFSAALDLETYDHVVNLLKKKDFEQLHSLLKEKEQLSVPYWVCAFSVNQHAGICGRAPPLDTTGHEIRPCQCHTEKHFDGDLSAAWLLGCLKKGSLGGIRFHLLYYCII